MGFDPAFGGAKTGAGMGEGAGSGRAWELGSGNPGIRLRKNREQGMPPGPGVQGYAVREPGVLGVGRRHGRGR